MSPEMANALLTEIPLSETDVSMACQMFGPTSDDLAFESDSDSDSDFYIHPSHMGYSHV